MALKKIQTDVHEWITPLEIGYFPPMDIMLNISEEVGELAREVGHMHGAKKKKASEDTGDMAGEMADIIFNLTCLANSHGIDLSDAWNKKMEKCYGRDKDRYEKK